MLPSKRSQEAPDKFKGHYFKIKEFICHYEQLLTQCQITTDKEICKGITTYYSIEVNQLIEFLDKYRIPQWKDLKEKLLHLYDAEGDEARNQLGDLDRLIYKHVKKSLCTLLDWKTYVQKLTVIAQWLKAEQVIQDEDYRTSFWLGIPEAIRNKVETHLLAGNTTKKVTEPFTVKEVSTIVEWLLYWNCFNYKRQHLKYKYETSDSESKSSTSSDSGSNSNPEDSKSEESESEHGIKHSKRSKTSRKKKSTTK